MEPVILVLLEMENVHHVKKIIMGQIVLWLVINAPFALMVFMEMVVVLLVKLINMAQHVLSVLVLMEIVLVKMDNV